MALKSSLFKIDLVLAAVCWKFLTKIKGDGCCLIMTLFMHSFWFSSVSSPCRALKRLYLIFIWTNGFYTVTFRPPPNFLCLPFFSTTWVAIKTDFIEVIFLYWLEIVFTFDITMFLFVGTFRWKFRDVSDRGAE